MKKAYIIIDMSNDFIDEKGALTAGTPGQKIAPTIAKTAREYLKKGDMVVITMDEHEKNDEHFKLWPEHNVKGSWGASPYGEVGELYSEYSGSKNLIYLPKQEYDAFHETGLGNMLRERGIDTVRLSGVCTDICVYLTCYGAYKEGFKTEVSGVECATFTNNHDVFLKSMESNFKTKLL
jgi:nicotinamidase-related amidase